MGVNFVLVFQSTLPCHCKILLMFYCLSLPEQTPITRRFPIQSTAINEEDICICEYTELVLMILS